MTIQVEDLIAIVVREVMAELERRGIRVDGEPGASSAMASAAAAPAAAPRKAAIDLGAYKTPVLAERHLASLPASVVEIVIPRGTVITPGAKDIIKKRSLVISSDLTAMRKG